MAEGLLDELRSVAFVGKPGGDRMPEVVDSQVGAAGLAANSVPLLEEVVARSVYLDPRREDIPASRLAR